jgi:DNA-binding response OmpR family regulator
MLVVGIEPTVSETVVALLRQLGHVAVWIDSTESAMEILDTVQCGLLFVVVLEDGDWQAAARLAGAHHCPVSVVTTFLSSDRRYRNAAFAAGAAAYLSLPCTLEQLEEAVTRLKRGDGAIELVREPWQLEHHERRPS